MQRKELGSEDILFKLPDKGIVNAIAKSFHGAIFGAQHYGSGVIGYLPTWLGVTVLLCNRKVIYGGKETQLGKEGKTVHPDQAQVIPHLGQQFIKIPLQVCRYHDVMRNTVENVQFFYSDLIDLIEAVQARNVDSERTKVIRMRNI